MTSAEIRFQKVLLVHGSSVLRETLRLVLGTHSKQVMTAQNMREGNNAIARNCDLDLVISDVKLADGDGFALLQRVALLENPRPQVILVTEHPNQEDRERAVSMGAVGYLGKPISFRDIAGALRRHGGHWNSMRHLRRRSIGRAYLLEPEDQGSKTRGAPFFWYLRDISASGAFLETESPIPVGTELELAIEVEDAKLRVRTRVIRVQEPGWGRVGGVGVAFLGLGSEERSVIEHHVADALHAW